MEHLNLTFLRTRNFLNYWLFVIESALLYGILLLYQVIIGCYFKLHFHQTKIIKILMMRISCTSFRYDFDHNIYMCVCVSIT